MSFKNALKNLVAHFGVVWSVLLYIILFAALITGLSMPFIMPIQRAFAEAGVFENLGRAFSALFNDGDWVVFWDLLYAIYESIVGVFASNAGIKSLSTAFLVFVVVVSFRFFLGLYEIPLASVLNGRLSCNSNFGLSGKFFSELITSVKYSFFKMLYTVILDAAIFSLIVAVTKAIGMSIALPFLLVLILLVFGAFRYTVSACWAPATVNGSGVIKGFARSVTIAFKRFGSIYSTYFIALTLMFALGAFITLFTFGIGLIIVLPICVTYVSYLNITIYYTKTGRRYYVDGIVVTPSTENAT